MQRWSRVDIVGIIGDGRLVVVHLTFIIVLVILVDLDISQD